MSAIILFILNAHHLKYIVRSVLILYTCRSNLTWTQLLFLSFKINTYNSGFCVISIREPQNYFRWRKEKKKNLPLLMFYSWKILECSKSCSITHSILWYPQLLDKMIKLSSITPCGSNNNDSGTEHRYKISASCFESKHLSLTSFIFHNFPAFDSAFRKQLETIFWQCSMSFKHYI